MIRTPSEYSEAKKRLTEEVTRFKAQEKHLKSMKLKSEEIKRAMDPLLSFQLQLKEEIESYERLQAGHIDEIRNLEGLGSLLIGLRIMLGITQKEMATRLGVDQSQVSRDEKNEYHGASIDRVQKILDAMGVKTKTIVELPNTPRKGKK